MSTPPAKKNTSATISPQGIRTPSPHEVHIRNGGASLSTQEWSQATPTQRVRHTPLSGKKSFPAMSPVCF